MVDSVVQSHAEIVVDSTEKSKIRVLHVDDEPALLKVAKQCLEMQGPFHVDTANSVEEALSKLEKERYDAVVSDYQMPGKDGLEFLKELRENGNKTPFIIFTGKGREEVAIKALNLGANQYLNKTGETETVYTELSHSITELAKTEKTEEALRQSEEEYRDLFENAMDAILTLDLKGSITAVNNSVLRLGYRKEDLVGKNFLDFVSKEYWPAVMRDFSKVTQGEPAKNEIELVVPTGKIIGEYYARATVKENNVAGVQISIRDVTERKKSEELLRESEERFRGLFESIQDPVGIFVGREGRLIDYNTALEELSGYTDEELKGKVFLDFVHPDHRDMVLEKYRTEYSEDEFPLIYEIRGVNKKGESIPLELSISRYRKKGKVIGIEVIHRDLTERKKAEEAVKESEAKYRMLVEQSLQGIVIAQGFPPRLVFANSAMATITGYSPDELTSLSPKQIEDLIHLDDRALFFGCFMDRLQEKSIPSRYEFRAFRKDGAVILLEISSSRIEYNGQPAVQAAFIDITERKQMEEEEKLRASEEKHRELANSLPEIVFEMDSQGKLTFANEKAYEISGHTREDFAKGLNALEFIVPQDREKARNNIEKTFRGEHKGPNEYTFQKKNGSTFPVAIHSSPILRGDRTIGVRGIIIDVTERKKIEKALRESDRRLRAVFDQTYEFIGLMTPDGMLIEANRTAMKFAGVNESEVLGKPFWLTPWWTHSQQAQERLREAIRKASQGEFDRFETTHLDKDGQLHYVDFSLKPVNDETGTVRYLVPEGRDITERKKMEDKLEVYSKHLEELVKQRTEDLMATQEELKQSEQKLRSVVCGSPIPAFFISKDHKVVYWNVALEKYSGLKVEEILGTDQHWKAFYDEKRPCLADLVVDEAIERIPEWHSGKYKKSELVEGGYEATDFFPSLGKKGKWLYFTAVAIRDSKENVIGGLETLEDITDRRNAEEVLRESEAKYRALVEEMPEVIYTISAEDATITSLNPAFEKLTGWERSEWIGKSFEELIHPDDLPLAMETFQKTIRGETLPPYELRVLSRSGECLVGEFTSKPQVERGKIVGEFGIVRDITERKKADRAFLENREKFEGLFMHSPEAAVYLGPDFGILDINPRFKEFFAYDLAEIRGRHIDDVVVPEGKIEDAKMLNEKAVQGYVYHNTVRRRKNGSLVPVSISAAPIVVGGRLVGYVGMYKDISELKNAEKKLETMNEKLRVVGGLTRHDVRNKLSAITGNIYLGKKKLADHPEVLQSFKDMDSACEQIVRIFEFAKDYERLGVEELTYVDMEKIVDEAVSLFPNLLGIRISNGCRGLVVLADSLLRQLFYNLIDNTLKYGGKATQIRIHYNIADKNQLRLFYEDNGVGIQSDEKRKLFREGHTTGKGSGYGLYLIGKMMEVYGWTMQETGTPGEGAHFIITMPKTNPSGKENYLVTAQSARQEQ